MDDFMLKELIPPIIDNIVFKRDLALENVTCVRFSPTSNSFNVILTLLPVCDINETPDIFEPL